LRMISGDAMNHNILSSDNRPILSIRFSFGGEALHRCIESRRGGVATQSFYHLLAATACRLRRYDPATAEARR
jgi:hypothetical protein